MNKTIKTLEVQRCGMEKHETFFDTLSIEEPLEIRLLQGPESHPVSVTMRTPGYDAELAIGFCFTEGIIKQKTDVVAISQSGDNIFTLELEASVPVSPATLARNFYTTSSCGVCGKASMDSIRVMHTAIESNIQIGATILRQLPELARPSQANFIQTGGSHASSLFTAEGKLLLTREDVGRHNALDKVIGHCLLNGVKMNHSILLVSGRASFELIQKAAVAGIPVVAAIGAPSSLAVELAMESGITLVGFLKADRFNIYSHPNRIIL